MLFYQAVTLESAPEEDWEAVKMMEEDLAVQKRWISQLDTNLKVRGCELLSCSQHVIEVGAVMMMMMMVVMVMMMMMMMVTMMMVVMMMMMVVMMMMMVMMMVVMVLILMVIMMMIMLMMIMNLV